MVNKKQTVSSVNICVRCWLAIPSKRFLHGGSCGCGTETRVAVPNHVFSQSSLLGREARRLENTMRICEVSGALHYQ